MNRFLTSNNAGYRLARTIIQGVLAVVVANMDAIVSVWSFSPLAKTLIVGVTMAVLSPIMAEIGLHTVEIATDDEIIKGAN